MLWWTVQNLVITAVLTAVVWTVCRIGRIGPVARHALWLVVVLKMLTPPLIVWPWAISASLSLLPHLAESEGQRLFAAAETQGLLPPSSPTSQTSSAQPLLVDPPRVNTNSTDKFVIVGDDPVVSVPHAASRLPLRTPAPERTRSFTWLLPFAAMLWLIGGLGFGLLQCMRIVRMSQRLRTARRVDGVFTHNVEVLAVELGMRAPPVRLVANLGSPLVWSLGRPELWWPEGLSAELSQEAISCLILHELAHVKRRDHWVGWLELLAGCLWWWNPLYWYARHQLRENAELACDGWVVNTLPTCRRAYGEALLAVCECLSRRSAPMPAVGVGTGGRQFLERRLAMILRERIPLRLPRAGFLVVGLLALITLPAWSQKAVPGGEGLVNLSGGQLQSGGFEQLPGSGAQTPSLPSDAQELLNRLEREQQQAMQTAQQRIAQARQQAIERLKALQDQYARAGQLDEAIAIRDRIRDLQGPVATASQGQAPPTNLVAYRDRIGQSFLFNVIGATEGPVWGTGVYTDDSTLAAAAVHAGALRPGERGLVRVTILPGCEHYQGSMRNGVTSSDYASWQGSYHVERVEEKQSTSPGDVLPDPGTLISYRDHVGMSFDFRVTGSTGGTIWGNGVYTDDSPLRVVAVHAGILKEGETGVVRVTILPGLDRYDGSIQRGVTSQPYGPFPGSFKVEAVRVRLSPGGEMPGPRFNRLQDLRGHDGETFRFEIIGSAEGAVWGSGVYTDDSSLPAAAVHAGVLRDGEGGVVSVTVLPGREHYEASDRHGVSSQSWGRWQGSFRVERAAAGSSAGGPSPQTY